MLHTGVAEAEARDYGARGWSGARAGMVGSRAGVVYIRGAEAMLAVGGREGQLDGGMAAGREMAHKQEPGHGCGDALQRLIVRPRARGGQEARNLKNERISHRRWDEWL